MKKILPKLLILLLIACLGTVFFILYEERFAYSTEKADLNAIYGVEGENDYPVILNDAFSDIHVRKIEDAYYMDYDLVLEMFNDGFYYGQADHKLVFCLAGDRIVTEAGTRQWYSHEDGTVTETYMPLVEEDGKSYVALDYVRKFANFEYAAFSEPNRVRMYTAWEPQTMVTAEKDTQIREFGGIKSAVIGEIHAGDELIVMEDLDDWLRVQTEDCLIGYLETKTVGNRRTVEREPITDYVHEEPTHLTMGGKVNMAWNMMASPAGADLIGGLMEQTQEVNVLAPTWFTVSDEEGHVNDIGSEDYVDWAHERDIQVWGVLDNFNTGVVMTEFLAREETRGRVIEAVIDAADEYGMDGINLDFESLGAEDGENFVEFVRELSISCRRKGLFFSIDNYVPYGFNDFYNLEEQARFADYVVIMGYDEHFAGSGEPGSVASIGYVEYGITEALKEVPPEQLINGMPFYTRVWTRSEEGVSSIALGMQETQDFITEHGMEKTWGRVEGQYYAEKEENGALYQVWVEDAESLKMKLDVARDYGIAGVAEWALGFETADVWDVIGDYMRE